MYPLSEAAHPSPTRFVDGRPYPLHTLPFYDIRALQDIHDIISVEPVQPRDKVMMGMLATIGIEPGKPFKPPEKLKAALEKGVVDAYYYMPAAGHEAICFESLLAGSALELRDGAG